MKFLEKYKLEWKKKQVVQQCMMNGHIRKDVLFATF
jgi:hypothetical protein